MTEVPEQRQRTFTMTEPGVHTLSTSVRFGADLAVTDALEWFGQDVVVTTTDVVVAGEVTGVRKMRLDDGTETFLLELSGGQALTGVTITQVESRSDYEARKEAEADDGEGH